MPGAGEASRGTTTSGAGAASRGAGAGASGSKKKSGGLFGKVKSAGKGLLGAVGSVLGAPQQIMFKAGQGTNDIVQGHFSEGLKSYGGALAEAGTLGQAGGDIDFANANRQWSGDNAKALKLPKGVNTASGVVIDPLNFATFGAGTAAKQATKVAATALSKEAAENLAKQGFKKGLTAAEKTTVRDAIVANAQHAKNPAKTADKQIKALTVRGRGGVGMHVPFTDIGATLIPGKTVAKGTKAIGLTAAKGAIKTSAPGRALRGAFVPGAAVAEKHGIKASSELLDAIGARSAGQANDVNDIVTRWNSAVTDFEKTAPKGVKFGTEQDTLVYRALESGDLAAAKAANPELSRLFDTADALRTQTDEGLRSSGALVGGTDDLSTFAHRTQTDEAAKALRGESDAIYEGRSISGSMTPGSAKARVVAPGSTADEVNEAVRLMHAGEQVPDGLLKDPGRVVEYQKVVQGRIDDLEAQAGEIRARHIEPATGDLTAAGKRRIAQLEGQAAVHKSIARQLKKQKTPAATKLTQADKRAANAAGKVDETTARLQKDADVRLLKDDEKRLATIKKQTERLTDKLAEKAKLAEDDTRAIVENIAQKLPPGTKLYRESAVASLIDSGADAAKAVSTAQLMNDIRAIKGVDKRAILLSGADVKNGAKVPEGWVSFDIPKLGTFHAPAAVKDEVTKFMSVIGQDAAVGQFQKYLTQWNRWWKGQVTASLPGGIPFASRNARSNVMLTWADGMSPTYFKTGAAFQLKVRGVVKNNAAAIADEGVLPVMKRELGQRDFEVWQAAREKGVIGDGFYNIDLTDAPNLKAAGAPKTGGKVKRGVRFVAGSHGTLATKGRELNQMVEQHARMSHFLYSIDRLGDLGSAAARTNTVLFNYGALTPFEQKVVKQILPFYTFMRKNVPGQYRALIENPSRIIGPEKLSKAMSDPLDEDSPEYQKRLGAHVSKVPGLAGLITTPERPFQAAVNAFEPLAQLGGALVPGDQGAIEPEKGVPQALRSAVSMVGGGPISLAKALIEEGTGKSAFTGYNLTEDERRQRLLASTYPALGRAPTLTGRLPSAIQKQGTKKKAKISSLAQLAALLGIKLEPSDK